MNIAQRKYLLGMIDKERDLAIKQANDDYNQRYQQAREAIVKKINGNKRFNSLTGRFLKTYEEMIKLLQDNHAEFLYWQHVPDVAKKAIEFTEYCSFDTYLKTEAGFEEMIDKQNRIRSVASDLTRRVLFPENGEKLVVDAFEVLAKEALLQA